MKIFFRTYKEIFYTSKVSSMHVCSNLGMFFFVVVVARNCLYLFTIFGVSRRFCVFRVHDIVTHNQNPGTR